MRRSTLVVLLAGLLSASPRLTARAADTATTHPVAPSGPRPFALTPNAPLVPSPYSAPGAALSLIPHAADPRLDPAVQAAMANPVPETARGIPAEAFTTTHAQLAATPLGGAVDAGRAVTDAMAPPSRKGVDAVSTHVFDGEAEHRAKLPAPERTADEPRPSARPEHAQISGAALLRAEQDRAKNGQTTLEYQRAKGYMFATADQIFVHGRHGVRDPYSQLFVPGVGKNAAAYTERPGQAGEVWHDERGMVVEHLWPQALFKSDYPMMSDLHMLMPTIPELNEKRGKRPFGVVRGNPDFSHPSGFKIGRGVVEPPDAAKGMIARRMLYAYLRYHDRPMFQGASAQRFWNDSLPTLLEWNERFPPTAEERGRNDLVQVEQRNRNPFVDDPTLASRIGLEALTAR